MHRPDHHRAACGHAAGARLSGRCRGGQPAWRCGPDRCPGADAVAGRRLGAGQFGSPGTGTLPHLPGAALFNGARVECQHVAYPGGPPAVAALLGGQISSLVLPEGLLRDHHATGKMRVIATSGAGRSPFLPQVPSFAEQGYPALVMREWFAFFMPGRAQAAVLGEISAVLQAAVRSPGFGASLSAAGMQAAATTPRALARQIGIEQGEWRRSLLASGIRVDG